MNKILPYHKATKALTQVEKVGQLFMPAAFINDTAEEIQKLENLIKEHHIGGLCFFHSRASAATNFEGKKKIIHNKQSFETVKKLIQRYQNVSRYPLIISIDAEWGLAMRIENTPQYPYAITLGAIEDNEDLIFQVGRNIAHDCKQAGIHWNLSPVTDINSNPNNPVIGYRSYGENKSEVVQKAMVFVKGAKSEGVLSCIKHFPGHGDTATDSHLGLPVIDKSKEDLFNNELYPFKKLIEHGIDAVMVGHLAVPALTNGEIISATISKDIIKGILRKELHFKGVVISDALNMHSVSKIFPRKGELEWLAFDAGNDVLCFAEHTSEGIKMILDNASENQIEESFERIWKLKESAFNIVNKTTIGPAGQVDSALINPDKLNQKLAHESLTFYKGNEGIIMNFKKEGFVGVEISQKKNTFFGRVQKEVEFNEYHSSKNSMEEIKKSIGAAKNVLLALFPPKVKPQNNFDIPNNEMECIQELIQHKNVVLYLFGNPYVLNKIDVENAKAIIIAYQDFEVFQENAARHFLGEFKAKGRLPVSINSSMA